MCNLNISKSTAPKQALPTVSASTVAELTPLPSISGSTVGQTAPTPTETSKAVLADAKTKMAPRKALSKQTLAACKAKTYLVPTWNDLKEARNNALRAGNMAAYAKINAEMKRLRPTSPGSGRLVASAQAKEA